MFLAIGITLLFFSSKVLCEIDVNGLEFQDKSFAAHYFEEGSGIVISDQFRRQSVSSQFCERRKAGFYPDLDINCQSYFICSENDTLELKCPANLKFDEHSCSCKRSAEVDCCPNTNLTRSCVPNHKASGDKSEENADKIRQAVCSDKGEGWYPDYSEECHTFFKCESRDDTTPVVLPCPEGMRFSSKACTCVSAKDETCENTLPYEACHIPEFDGCKYLAPGAYVSYIHDCERYFICSPFSEETYFFDCPEHEKFDLHSCTCVPENTVNCTYCASLRPCIQTTTTSTTTTTTTTPTTTTTTPTTTTTTPTTTTTTPTTTTTTPTTTTTTPTTTTTTPTTTTTTPTTTTVPTPPPGTCSGKATGLYPYVQSGCQCYYGCIEGIDHAYSYMCPPYYRFDIRSCTCLPAYLVDCDDTCEERGCTPKPPPTTTTLTPPTTPYSDFCHGKGPGYYSDINRNCEWYFVCMGGSYVTYQFHCPSDLRFNHLTCECEYPYTVPCTILDSSPCFPKTTTLAPTPSTALTPTPDPEHFCEGKVPGFYIDDTKPCKFYYFCVPGNPTPFIFQCDPNHKFDVITGECVWTDDLRCQ